MHGIAIDAGELQAGEFSRQLFFHALRSEAKEAQFLFAVGAEFGQWLHREAIVAMQLAGVQAFLVRAAVGMGAGGAVIGHRRVAVFAVDRVLAR